ncbi:MAG TPA: PEP-CTERM sorting domain-containing protein [Candidatus Acidoferrales bacterium]|nr:PEP-CTERM sorting domain-containing protein [Candidatus Acidoferrales bacterium]
MLICSRCAPGAGSYPSILELELDLDIEAALAYAPEPGTWVLMLTGLALVGSTIRGNGTIAAGTSA